MPRQPRGGRPTERRLTMLTDLLVSDTGVYALFALILVVSVMAGLASVVLRSIRLGAAVALLAVAVIAVVWGRSLVALIS